MRVFAASTILFLAPVIAWNLAFTRALKIDRFFPGSAPRLLRTAEAISRAFVFVYPLFLATHPQSPLFRIGLGTYTGGSILYYASWIALMRLPEATVRRHRLLPLAPAYTPALFLSGIAMMTESPLYGGAALLFVALHTFEYVYRLP